MRLLDGNDLCALLSFVPKSNLDLPGSLAGSRGFRIEMGRESSVVLEDPVDLTGLRSRTRHFQKRDL
jgi:hypothetical protein